MIIIAKGLQILAAIIFFIQAAINFYNVYRIIRDKEPINLDFSEMTIIWTTGLLCFCAGKIFEVL